MKLNIKTFILSLFIFSAMTLAGQALSVGVGENYENLHSVKKDGFHLELGVSKLDFTKVKYETSYYYRASIPGFARGLKAGNPQLPVYRKLIEIPKGAQVNISFTKMHFRIYKLNDYNISYPVYPAQESVVKTEDARFDFQKNIDAYSRDAFYSEPLFSIDELGEMRGHRIARLNLAMVEYNPVKNELKVYDSLEIVVKFQLAQTAKENVPGYDPVFSGLGQYLLNAKAYQQAILPQNVQYPLKMVIVADSSFRSSLQDFIHWKEKQGYKIIEAYTSDTAVGKTNTSIKAYLQGLYNAGTATDPAPSYVLLVGDVGQIPKYPGKYNSWAADLYYCEFTGDYFPEMMYGRFSANDTAQLNPIIEKTIAYEKYLLSSPSFLDTSMLISGKDATYSPTNGDGQINYGVNYYFNSSNNIVCKSYLYVNQSYLKDVEIRNNADSGAAIINYTGHGLASGWKDPSFRISHVSQMKNKGKYSLMVGNACLTNKFDTPVCFGEALTRAKNKGAVAYIGASDNTLWDEDYYWAVGYGNVSANPTYASTTSGFYDLIFHTHNEAYSQWALSAYQYLEAGNMAVTQGGSNVRRYWELYHLLGDPSLMPYLFVPSPITATYNPLLALGLSSYTVTTEPYALVALSRNDSLIASTWADSTGVANLYFPVFTQPGPLDLVITASQKQPYFGSIIAGSPNNPYIIFDDYEIVDSSSNNNQQLDYNENTKLNMSFVNITSHATDSVYAILKTSNPSVNITDSIFYIGNFPAYDTLVFDTAFSLFILPDVKDGEDIKFNLIVNDSSGLQWNSHFYITAHAPDLLPQTAIVDDQQSGNGNGRVDPGETVWIRIPLLNKGSLPADSLFCSLTTNYSGASIANTNFYIDTIKTDSVGYALFEVTFDNSFKTGDIVRFNFECNGHNRIVSKVYSLLFGEVDEDFESGDFSRFQWIGDKSSPWFVQDTVVYEGSHAACSAVPLNDKDTSSLSITLKVLSDDSISFYQRVSSEFNYDYLYFYIDNKVKGKWSGSHSWKRESYTVQEGVHTFKWAYIKDNYGKEYMDAVFLDMINFPPTDAWTSVENSEKEILSMSLAPNPASDYTVLSFDIERDAAAEFVLFDSKGQQIKLLGRVSKLAGGPKQININTSDLPAGIYIIGVISPVGKWYKKLIVSGK